MAKYNPFDFLKRVQRGNHPTREDLDLFEPYITQMVVSMGGVDGYVEAMNTPEFFALSKETQCMAYTAFKGKNLVSKWKKSRKQSKSIDKLLPMVMDVYSISTSEARVLISDGVVDEDEVIRQYGLKNPL